MNMFCKAFLKKIFGADYRKLTHPLSICLVVFWGLSIAGFKVQIAPSVLYLTVSAFTGGVMWQALSSRDNAAQLWHMLMLPFDRQKLVFSYVAVLGVYTVFTKTAGLLAVLLAVSVQSPLEITGSVLCAVHAVLLASVLFALRKRRYLGILWAAAVAAAIVIPGNKPWLLPALTASSVLTLLLLCRLDGYVFYLGDQRKNRNQKKAASGSLWKYLFRYLNNHRNYLANTAVMWCVACVLPLFFSRVKGLPMAPLGFAILSLNTPVCILLSCDPALEQAVRILPGQKKAFFIPYCLFVFLCNMSADVIFLCSLKLHLGGVTLAMIALALFFALQSAILSVLLEWRFPLKGWNLESDLWHHPRKYLVPGCMLLLAGAVGALPALLPVLLLLLAVQIAILIFLHL